MKPLMFLLALFFTFSCTRSGQPVIKTNKGNCENAITIDEQRYNQTSPNTFGITKCEINGDCLEVTIATSGCDGSTWKAELVTSGAVAESYPPQMYFKILFKNEEDCFAVLSKKISYNLKPLRVSGVNKVTLNLQGWNQQVLYQY